AEAEEHCRHLLARHGEQAHLIDLRPYPHGFVVKHGRMPGNLMPAPEEEEPDGRRLPILLPPEEAARGPRRTSADGRRRS
ncbi:hypothetical protein, partial [Thermogemmatispora sp.]|uniref:hypothetical protein n=1 Tax=Thermogemmatispora sp. TaxID=1968838 RepID=UPI0035E3FBAC